MGREAGGGERAVGGRRLAQAQSAYLRSAAEQGIEWHPWGPEPFERAAKLHRPVLLDIGAAWCHWCHVMDEGTYSDAEVTRLINENFVAVKVDRDENPEVDRRYQRQVGALTGEGGWPLTGFLTPDGAAFFGGTYFPATDQHGRPGFRRVLKEVDRLWRTAPGTIQENTGAVAAAVVRMSEGARPSGRAGAGRSFVGGVAARLASSFDPVHAGFGQAPKFPHPSALAFLHWEGFATGEERPTARALETLLKMADGGMNDQLAGGFHRYSVDEGWHIPHFEKMGIDNAALLASYEEGVRAFGDPRLLETLTGTAGWVRTVLGDPDGGFAASQDADNAPGDDGAYFTWSRKEIDGALEPTDAKLVRLLFGVGTEGRMPHDPERNVLFRAAALPEVASGLGLSPEEAGRRLEAALATLRAVRAQRPTPVVDRARYAGINGAMIGSLARAARTLADPALLADARRAADRLLARAYRPEAGIAHRLGADGGSGFGRLEDNALVAAGLVELAGASAEPRYAQAAGALLGLIEREFRSDAGPLLDLAPRLYDGPVIGALGEKVYPVEDTPNLAPNAAVALAEIRYAALVGELGAGGPLDRARSLLGALLPRLDGAGLFGAGTALAVGLAETPAARVVVVGSGAAADALARAAERTWHPNAWVFRGVPPEPFSLPEELAGAGGPSGGARALLCFGDRCLPPITEPAALSAALRGAERPRA